MQEITITKQWQKLSDLATLKNDTSYYLQNNSEVFIHFYIGEEEPNNDYNGGIIYFIQGLKGIQSTDNIWLKITATDLQKVVIFEVE